MARAIDLYRFDLYEQLHYSLPSNLAEERELNARINRLVSGRLSEAELRLPYKHPVQG